MYTDSSKQLGCLTSYPGLRSHGSTMKYNELEETNCSEQSKAAIKVRNKPNQPTYSQVLVEEVQNNGVPPLVLLPDLLVLEVTSRSHPTMHLIGESLNVIRHLQVLLKTLDRLFVLVFRW